MSNEELIDCALLSCKAMLALGAQIPDGSFDDMQRKFDELFPSIAKERSTKAPDVLQTQKVQVAIDGTGSHQTWFQASPGRAGRERFVAEPDCTFPGSPRGFTRWDVALKNLLRLGIQKHIEERASYSARGTLS